MNKVTCGIVPPSNPSPPNSRISTSSSTSTKNSVISLGRMEAKYLKYGDSYLEAGDYDNTIYYYESLLNSVEKYYTKGDDRILLAYEKLADAEAAFGKRESAIQFYRTCLDELRSKIEDITDSTYEKELNTKLSRMLVNCGNVYLQSSLSPNVKKRKMSEYCENAILCYKEALPVVQELHGMKSVMSIKLVQKYLAARDNLAKYYLESGKINLASTQYQESIKTIIPCMDELSRQHNDGEEKNSRNDSKSIIGSYSKEDGNPYRLMQYLYLKQTINVGSLCLRQNRLDIVVIKYGEALDRLGLREDDEEYDKKLEELPASIAKLVCTISHNLGVISMKRHTLEDTEFARNHFERAICLNKKHNLSAGVSILGLGEACFELKEYDKALKNLLEAERLLLFEQSTSYNKAFSDAYGKIASVYEMETEYEMCFNYLDKQIQFVKWTLINEGNNELQRKEVSAIYHRKALIQFQLKKYKEALQSHEVALRYRSKLSDHYFASQTLSAMGKVHAGAGEIKLALECFDGALDYLSDKEKMPIYFEMADVLTKMSYDYEAIVSYQSCLALATEPEHIQFNTSIITTCIDKLGQLLIKFQEYMILKDACQDVIQKMEKVTCSNEEKSTLFMYLGKAHYYLGDYDLALDDFMNAEKVLTKNSDFECVKSAVFGIVDVHTKKNESNNALTSLEKLLASVPSAVPDRFARQMETAAIHNKISSIHVQFQKYDEALQSCRKVLSAKEAAYSMRIGSGSDPDADIAQTHVDTADVYILKKQYNTALEHLRKASSVVDEIETKALILCTIGKVETLMQSQYDALDSFQAAHEMVMEDKEVKPETKSKVIHHLAAFNSMTFRLEDAIENYRSALLLQNKDYEKDRADLLKSLTKSKVTITKDIDALQFFHANQNRLQISTFCVTYDDIKSVANKIIKHFMREKDYTSCATCINCMINFAMLLIADKIDLTLAVAKSIGEIGRMMQQAREYDVAIRFHEFSLCAKRILYKGENQDTSFSYSCIGEVYDGKGEYQNSLNNLKEAMNGSDQDDKLLIIDKMAMVLLQMQRFDDAKDCYNSALINCHNPEQRILLLNNLGNVHIRSREFDKALSCYSEALAMKSKDKTIDKETEYVLFNIGFTHFLKNAYDQALETFTSFLSERASSTISQDNSLVSSIIASVLNCFGVVNLKMRNYQEAKGWLEQSVSILREIQNQSKDLLAGALSNLGCSLFYIGDYETALLNLTEAIQLSKLTIQKNDNLLASVLIKSAWINFRLKNYEVSLEEYQQAMELKKDDGVLDVATLHNIALVYCKLHNFEEAVDILNRVRDHTIATQGAYHPDVAKVHIDLGIISYKQKHFNDAESHYAKASVILEKANFSQEDPYQVQYLRAVSKLWSKMNK